VVSLANYCPNCGESLGSSSTRKGEERKTARRAYEKPKAKRKASAYQKRVGREMKRLKKQHSKKNGDWKKGWNNSRWMSAAHKAARRK